MIPLSSTRKQQFFKSWSNPTDLNLILVNTYKLNIRISWVVLCQGLSQNLCIVKESLRCPRIFALSQNLCVVLESLRCPRIFALSQNLCVVQESLRCPRIFALSQNLGVVQESLRCPSIFWFSYVSVCTCSYVLCLHD